MSAIELLTAAALAAGSPPRAGVAPPLDRLEIVAPASSGGGFDLTAHAMQQVLEASGLVGKVEVVNSPGAGGAIGLAQFTGSRRGQGDALLVGGVVMIRAIRANNAAVSLLQATPVARLTGEYQVLAVPSGSDIKSLDELVEAFRSNPGAVSWAGGSTGGIDHHLVGLIARAAGVEPGRVNYVPFTGGADAAAALVANRVTAGVSGYAEFEPEIRSGRLRPLGVSSEGRRPGIPTPTLKEQGLDVAVVNWRGVFAPPGLSEAQGQRLAAVLHAMVRDRRWQETLRRHHWTDLYLAGEQFGRFVEAEQSRLQEDPRAENAPAPPFSRPFVIRMLGRYGWLLVFGTLGLVALSLAILRRQKTAARKREDELARDLESARESARLSGEEARIVLRGLGEEIDRQFEAWALTSAEREVALLMLKGLRHKEIAQIRNTSERTVRQQALVIYKKAGLEGRSDLAAFFLEDLLQPATPRSPVTSSK